ncbi:transglutaminase domain-containing protein, partial [Candidatus Dojkabacteria bacterium]|nr:transglutaminase domain-containing protein [Candidatus Dojkabacteria bacterium]
AVSTVSVTEGGRTRQYRVTIENNSAEITVPYNDNVNPGESKTFVFSYIHPSLVYENGSLIDAYIHAFSKDYEFTVGSTSTQFSTKLQIPSNLFKDPNFVYPEARSVVQTDTYVTYEFSQQSLVDQFVWLQLGREQVYDFTLIQDISPTEDRLTGLFNTFELILPRELTTDTISQEVFFTEITPEPISVFTDEEGNVFAEFNFPSNEPQQVSISGYAIVKHEKNEIFENYSGTVEEIPEEIVAKYTKPSEYWEVMDPRIQEKAQELKGTETNVLAIASNVYSYVVDTIDYSQVKRFGLNERQGALATLEGGAAVCMEYSDLFLTLMRANGIPARAVFGYGYDPRIESAQQEAHQWVQIYMPGLTHPWVDVDVTWGESGELLIGGDLNHFYTHVAYENPNVPAMISRYSFQNSGDLHPPSFDIQTINTMPTDLSNVTSVEDLISRYPRQEQSDVERFTSYVSNRFLAGYSSLREGGFDIGNTSQLLFIIASALGTISMYSAVRWLISIATKNK